MVDDTETKPTFQELLNQRVTLLTNFLTIFLNGLLVTFLNELLITLLNELFITPPTLLLQKCFLEFRGHPN